MKKYITLISIVLIGFYSCTNKNIFQVQINLDNAEDKMIYLYQAVNEQNTVIDSAQIEHGTACLKTTLVSEPEMLTIVVDGVRENIWFFAENKAMTISGDIKNIREIVISGSESQALLNDFNQTFQDFDMQIHNLYPFFPEEETEETKDLVDSLTAIYEEITEQKNVFLTKFLKENSQSIVSHYLLLRNSYEYELEELEALVSEFGNNVSSVYLTRLQEFVATLKRVAIGKPYVDFTMNDPEGNPISLASQIGPKLLLVDFWASWCGPCRAENPYVVAVYNEYKTKGFNVFGVSFDGDKEAWLEAIEKDNLTWNHVSDLQGWNNAAGKLYGIRSIPQSILLDEKGIIIAKNLRGDDLRKKVAETLD